MVLVEAGSFDFNTGTANHNVTLTRDFYMGNYEVKYTASTTSSPKAKFEWFDAVELCNEWSEKEGLDNAYTIIKDPNNPLHDSKWVITCDFSKNGYRLPTVAEWRYAARGGQHTETHPFTFAGVAVILLLLITVKLRVCTLATLVRHMMMSVFV